MILKLKPIAFTTLLTGLSACAVWQKGFTFNVDGQPHQGLVYYVANQPDRVVGYAIVWDGEVIKCESIAECEREIRFLREDRKAGEIASTPAPGSAESSQGDGKPERTGNPIDDTELTGGAPGGA